MKRVSKRKHVEEVLQYHEHDEHSVEDDSPYQQGEIVNTDDDTTLAPESGKLPMEKLSKIENGGTKSSSGAQQPTAHMLIALPDVPYQPADVPPYRDRRRPHLFQSKWYKTYPWLHFDVATESMFCFQCISSILQGRLPAPTANIFCQGGFRNWKKGVERFRVHENSPTHRQSSEFSVQPLLDIKEKCHGVEIIVSTINFLISVGYNTQQPYLSDLLALRRAELPALEEHLAKAKFSKEDEQNLLNIMKTVTMRTVSSLIKDRPYGLILEKVSVHGKTLFAVSVRVSNATKPEEYFIGLYDEENILHELANHLEAEGLWVFSCDSKTIAETLESIQPGVHRVRSPNHSLIIDLQDMLKISSPAGRTVLLVEELTRALPIFTLADESQEQRPLCPKRLAQITKILPQVLDNYEHILEELGDKQNQTFSSLKILEEMKQPSTVFDILMLKTLLYPVDSLCSMISKSESVRCLKETVDSVLHILESYKADDDFESFMVKYARTIDSLKLSASDKSGNAIQKSNTAYITTIDLIIDYLKAIFNHQSYGAFTKMEDTLLLNGEASIQRAETILKSNRIEPDAIAMEKQMLKKVIRIEENENLSLPKLITELRNLPTGTLGLLPHIVKVVDRLILAQVAKSGEGYGRMRHVRSFLETCRSEDLVNELSILYVYRTEPFMNIQEVAREYFMANQGVDSVTYKPLFDTAVAELHPIFSKSWQLRYRKVDHQLP